MTKDLMQHLCSLLRCALNGMHRMICFLFCASFVLPPVQGAERSLQSSAALPLQTETVAVIDLDYVIRNAKATQHIQGRADTKRDLLQKQVETYESMLRKEQDELNEMVNRKDPEARAKKQAFENKLTDVRNTISERSRVLSDAFGKARDTVFAKVQEIVRRLSQERQLSLVISSNAVVYQDGFDLTNDVLQIINKELPVIDIPLPDHDPKMQIE